MFWGDTKIFTIIFSINYSSKTLDGRKRKKAWHFQLSRDCLNPWKAVKYNQLLFEVFPQIIIVLMQLTPEHTGTRAVNLHPLKYPHVITPGLLPLGVSNCMLKMQLTLEQQSFELQG